MGVEYVEPALIASYYPEMTDGYFRCEVAREMSKWIEERGLKVLAMSGHTSLGRPEALDGFRRRMEFAGILGARIVHTNAALVGERDVFLHNLEALIPMAEELNLIIALENPGDGGANLVPTGEAGAALVRRIGSPRVRLNYDFSNVYSYSRGGVRPEDDFHHAIGSAAHLHLKEIRPVAAGWAFVEIGGGVTDYGAILSSLAAADARLPMSIELPLRFAREADYGIVLKPGAPPRPLPEIRAVLQASIRFIFRNLGLTRQSGRM